MYTDKVAHSSMKSLLNENSEILSALCIRASKISGLQKTLHDKIGPPLSEHLTVANFNNQSLTIHTDSPAWASRLRFSIPVILDAVRHIRGLENLHSIRIKVALADNTKKTTARKLSLSDETIQLIKNTAQSTNDNNLRAALLRLVSNKS